jgi:hypothetical protein
MGKYDVVEMFLPWDRRQPAGSSFFILSHQ